MARHQSQCHLNAKLTQEVAVMGNQQHGAWKRAQDVDHMLAGGDIEIVGDLVKNQQRWRTSGDASQRQPHLLPAGQCRHAPR